MTGGNLEHTHSTNAVKHSPLSHLKTIGVYTITCRANGMIYIGMSCDIAHRTSCHLAKLRSGKHSTKRMLEDFRSFGEEQFCFEIASLYPTAKAARVAEADMIADYIKRGLAYNARVPHFYTPLTSENKVTIKKRAKSSFDSAAKLKAWMEKNGKTVSDMARAIGMSRYGAYRILWGNIPRQKNMQAIATWTNFEITANDFFDLVFPPRQEAAA